MRKATLTIARNTKVPLIRVSVKETSFVIDPREPLLEPSFTVSGKRGRAAFERLSQTKAVTDFQMWMPVTDGRPATFGLRGYVTKIRRQKARTLTTATIQPVAEYQP